MGLTRWLMEKAATYLLAFAFFYIIGEALGIVPQPIKDFIAWLRENFTILCIFIGFLAALYVAFKLGMKANRET